MIDQNSVNLWFFNQKQRKRKKLPIVNVMAQNANCFFLIYIKFPHIGDYIVLVDIERQNFNISKHLKLIRMKLYILLNQSPRGAMVVFSVEQ